jgi:hypothetical protein
MRSRRKTLSRFGYAVILFFFARPDLSGQWLRLYKGTPSGPMPPFLDNRIIGIVQADDGGFLAASNDPTGLWVKKLRTNGTIEWQRTYDLNGAKRLASDSDGYLIANDRGVLKIGRDGTPVWYRAILISSTGQAGAIESVCSTGNGGFVAAGRTTSGSDADAFAAQVGSTGAVEWAWAFGGDLEDSATDVSRTEDGGYVLAGFCTSLTPGNGQDVWVVKLSGPGDIVWQKNYGGAAREAGSSLRQTPEGGYVLGGWTDTGDSRGWILKLTATGEFEWQRRVGTSMSCSAAVATDGGLIAVAGHAIVRFSPGGDVSWKKDLPAISSDFMDHRFSGIFGVADGSIFAYGSASTPGSEIGLAALLASDGTIGSCGLIQEGSCSIQEAQIPAFESHVIPRALIPVVVGGTGGQAKAIAGTTVLLCPSADPAVQLSLSPRRLNFASAIGGPSTPPQSFVVRNAGNGPFQWTIEDAPPWLRFSAQANR